MAKTKTGQRVAIWLDTRIALEAVLLNRLERLPVNRRQEWLRGLLMQEFRAECQALRETPDVTARRSTAGYVNGKAGEPPTRTSSPEPEPVAMKQRHATNNTPGKPFAVLGKVVG